MNLGSKIKLLRENKGIGQQELCDFLGIEQSTLANYENDRRTPKPEMIAKIADFFNTTTDYLLGRTDIKNPSEYEIKTIAAHFDGDEFTEEELKQIEQFVKMKREQNKE